MRLRPYQQEIVDKVKIALKHRKKSVLVVLPCGGGKSVIIGAIAKMTTDKRNKILFLVHRAELCDQIQETFEKIGVDRSKSNICMVQMAERIMDIDYVGFKPDVIITDEAHHSMASNYIKIYNAYPDAIKIGFTATPTRLDNLNLNQIYEEIIESVSVQWLIDNKYLAPFRYYSASFIDDLEDIHEKTIYSDIIESYNKFAKNKQAICYCPNVKISKMIASLFKDNGISAEHLDGSTKKSLRDSVITEFKTGKLKIICNVDLISEGFDVPDCEVVILLRETQSLTLFVQQSMRSMRYKPNKTAIIIDHVGNYLKFGLPTQLRNWEYLNENKNGKKTGKSTQNDEKVCPNCYSVFTKNGNFETIENGFKYECPFCHHVWKEKLKEQIGLTFKDCNLDEITGFTLKIDKSYKDCKNIFELYNHAVENCYKKSWVVHKSKELGFLKSLEDYQKLSKILGYKKGWAYFQYKSRE